MNKKISGFSAIEIVIAAAILAVFSIIAFPKFSSVIRKSQEGAAKNALGSLRSAVAMYYGDNEGEYPSSDIAAVLAQNKQYIEKIPDLKIPGHHKKTNKIITSGYLENNDTGEWAYKLDDSDDGTGKTKGQIWINCSHKDSKGVIWSDI